ncbi:LuxR C-terminal-related transcriptional regulator [Nocardiopsis sp. N85]|uniref:ATP-binding protein n=1 Tax=Nocardiopsis sp. N85 TaxID=3029400 RepID=UPI00237F90ED|nr:LuxR C-terminal-related transcriptional regulator [Nocardiopsis sp. N85]MDE3723184.1 LuxR C-terminal-related transcriptional regulator [Nocardiopsis sp. N85]
MLVPSQSVADPSPFEPRPFTPWNHFSTPLIGREGELEALRRRLTDPSARIVTVTGPVGVGKSRLAATAFNDVLPTFAGARSLDLDSLRSDAELQRTLYDVLETNPAGPGPSEGRRFLLALDGCDRFMERLPSLLTGLLATHHHLSLLVVAPWSLGVYEEQILRLAPLETPCVKGTDGLAQLRRLPSVQLFVRRTRTVRPEFELTPENHEAVARLCAMTDGLPLAIELAAAQMKLCSPQVVLSELVRDLDVLSADGGGTLSAHTGMRSAISMSLNRLHGLDREFLGQVAAFHEGFDLPSAVAVTGLSPAEVQHLLERLVDMNVLYTGECDDGDVTFRLSSLTRRHVLDRLREIGGLERVLRSHAAYFLRLTDSLHGPPASGERERLLPRLRQWSTDTRSAMGFLLDDGDHAGAIRLAFALRGYWHGNGRVRGITEMLDRVLSDPGIPERVSVEGRGILGELLVWVGEYDRAEEHLRASLNAYETASDQRGAATGRRRLGSLAMYRGEVGDAERLLEKSSWELASASEEYEQALALRDLALCRMMSGDHAAAEATAQQARREFARWGDEREEAMTDCVLAETFWAREGAERALPRYRAALEAVHASGDRAACATGVERAAVLMAREQTLTDEGWRTIARALGAAVAMRSGTDCLPPACLGGAVSDAVDRARLRLGVRVFNECWGRGLALTPEEVIGEVLDPSGLAAPPEESAYPEDGPLTKREFQVAELVARGMTNREVARNLGISEWTAVNHLRRIMRKLDCSSRVQVAGWFTRRGRPVRSAGTPT